MNAANRLSIATSLLANDATLAESARVRIAAEVAAGLERAEIAESVEYRGKTYHHLWIRPAGYRRSIEVRFAPRKAGSMIRRLMA